MPNIAVRGFRMIFYENRSTKYFFSSPNSFNFFAHAHKEIELIYVEKGVLIVESNFQKHIINEGNFYIAFPHTIHAYKSEGDFKSYMWIFDNSYISDYSSFFSKYATDNPVVQVRNSDIDYCVEQFNKRKNLHEDNILTRSFLTIILSYIVQNLHATKLASTNANEWLPELLRFLSENHTKKISLDMISKDIGVSKYHISRTFTATIGCSITRYLNTIRTHSAIDLLQKSDKSITEIAFDCGYESLTSFFRAFRELGLKSPKQYRNQQFKIE